MIHAHRQRMARAKTVVETPKLKENSESPLRLMLCLSGFHSEVSLRLQSAIRTRPNKGRKKTQNLSVQLASQNPRRVECGGLEMQQRGRKWRHHNFEWRGRAEKYRQVVRRYMYAQKRSMHRGLQLFSRAVPGAESVLVGPPRTLGGGGAWFY
jgi:hypothetical protein